MEQGTGWTARAADEGGAGTLGRERVSKRSERGAKGRGRGAEGAGAGGERLQKLLSRSGVASRRKAEALIEAGRVTVDGKVATLGQRAQPGEDVRVDGVALPPPVAPVTYLLNKPSGVLTTVTDDRGRATVMDLVPPMPGLHPVGRLDLDSEGLLLLTTDGDLTLHLSHPRYGHDKEYRVWCAEGTPPAHVLARLVRGVDLEDGVAKALEARPANGGCMLLLGEGRNRQVRRMLAAVGFKVTRLRRTRFGSLKLDGLEPGEYRSLSHAEVEQLRAEG